MAVGARPARPTIRDVAAAAGVSLGTASRVLNGHKNVSAGSVDRVRMAVSKLGFQLNAHARSLRSAHSSTIGVLGSDISVCCLSMPPNGPRAHLHFTPDGRITHE